MFCFSCGEMNNYPDSDSSNTYIGDNKMDTAEFTVPEAVSDERNCSDGMNDVTVDLKSTVVQPFVIQPVTSDEMSSQPQGWLSCLLISSV